MGKAGPGILKARGLSLVHASTTTRVRLANARWKALFEEADAVSEGGSRLEMGPPPGTPSSSVGPRRVWYGSTSLIVPLPPEVPRSEREFLAEACARDLHVRLRALRVARREAQSRAPATLGRATCEIRVSVDPRGVRIDVDLQAPLIEGGLQVARS